MAYVPKFGNWDNDEQVPYTQYFDNARKGRNVGKMINPNDPQENPEAFPQNAQPMQASPSRMSSDPEALKAKHRRRTSREDADLVRSTTDSPARHDAARKPFADSPQQWRPRRMSAGSDRSVEQSPLHHQGKPARGGVDSPAWEKKASAEGHGAAPHTPGRYRMKHGGRNDETLDKGSAVPKFGEWDKGDPRSADAYTVMFNKVREEKQTGSARVPIIRNESSYPDGYEHSSSSENSGCSCFSWLRK